MKPQKKLKELGPDVNADPEILPPSGKLYRRSGEKAARQYIPVRTHNGEYLILAAQGDYDYDKMRKIGEPYGNGDVGYFRSVQAAKQSLFRQLEKDGSPSPRDAFYTKVVHLNPTDFHASGELESAERAGREREEREERSERDRDDRRAPSGLARSRDGAVSLGETDGEKSLPALRRRFRGKPSLSSPEVRREMTNAIKQMAVDGAGKRRLHGADASAYREAFHARAMNRLLATSSSGWASSGAASGDKEKLEKIQGRLRSYALSPRSDSERDRWAAESVRRLVTRDIPMRIARGQTELALQAVKNLPKDLERLGSPNVAADVRKILSDAGIAPSGELSRGARTGLLVAGLGALVVGVTAIAQKVAKDQASRSA